MNRQIYTIATRDNDGQQFASWEFNSDGIQQLMTLSDAKILVSQFRSRGIDAVAYNTQVGV
jgi:hypothetical protein